MNSHEIDYEIFGDSMQVVEIELDKDETVIAEAGMMSWMDANIKFETKAGDGSSLNEGFFGKVWGMGKRLLTRESLFMTHFTNTVDKKQKVAFASPFPGKIMPIDLKETGKLICQKDSFLCAARGTKLDLEFNKRLTSGFFGGEGFILQSLSGDGKAFIHAGGTIVKKELKDEKLIVDTGSLVAFTQGLEYKVEVSSSIKSMLFGGEGIFLTTLEGTGTVYLQSLPFSRLADRIIAQIPKGEGHFDIADK
ncbi:TIGR00266 family protein [Halarcobacter bivalviorum]|uniref:TIGR00266 family protein n=1 Tax=Halarcobacter bivalviorum TaxID=663364 RepID=UPI00100B67D0|nr:TIGR00266 family protein [Halarcobacter bivalviorum]RXK07082.1 TIGR00266 family protein [Halarcobacter bivalviorum]